MADEDRIFELSQHSSALNAGYRVEYLMKGVEPYTDSWMEGSQLAPSRDEAKRIAEAAVARGCKWVVIKTRTT